MYEINRIMPIPKPDELLDKAFRRMKTKNSDRDKISSFCSTLSSDLKRASSQFPNIDELPEFYRALVDYTVGIAELKKSLNSVNWASKKILQIQRSVKDKKAVFGRASSIVKKVSKNLKFLDDARKQFDSFPKIKDMFTVCITGFPNVGKTTLLSLITKSVPEIKPYPFTTKRLNSAYFTSGGVEIQFLDTPGTLNRVDKMNKVELQSFLAMKLAAHLVIFVIDPTSELKRQVVLLRKVLSYKKPVIVYLSKSDLVDESVLNFVKSELPKSVEVITTPHNLKEEVVKHASEYYKNLLGI